MFIVKWMVSTSEVLSYIYGLFYSFLGPAVANTLNVCSCMYSHHSVTLFLYSFLTDSLLTLAERGVCEGTGGGSGVDGE